MTDFHSGDVVRLDKFLVKDYPKFEGQELVVITVSKHVLKVKKSDGTSLTGTHGCFELIRKAGESCE